MNTLVVDNMLRKKKLSIAIMNWFGFVKIIYVFTPILVYTHTVA